jgi:hypothetical protein
MCIRVVAYCAVLCRGLAPTAINAAPLRGAEGMRGGRMGVSAGLKSVAMRRQHRWCCHAAAWGRGCVCAQSHQQGRHIGLPLPIRMVVRHFP